MNRTTIIQFIIIILGIIIIYYVSTYNKNNNNKGKTIYVISEPDNKKYLVQDLDDKENAANLLSIVYQRIFLMKKYLCENVDKYPEYKQYIKQFCDRINKLVLQENSPTGKYTSYTVNKGEEIALCLRSKKTTRLHDINIIMYVTIHELSHVACPDLDHTEKFTKIFIFFLNIAIMLGLYVYANYQENPIEYCGLPIRENLLK